jgi:hypothetical protein
METFLIGVLNERGVGLSMTRKMRVYISEPLTVPRAPISTSKLIALTNQDYLFPNAVGLVYDLFIKEVFTSPSTLFLHLP